MNLMSQALRVVGADASVLHANAGQLRFGRQDGGVGISIVLLVREHAVIALWELDVAHVVFVCLGHDFGVLGGDGVGGRW